MCLERLHGLHPLQLVESAALQLYYNLNGLLAESQVQSEFTINPFAGAHGELTGLMVMRQYHMMRDDKRTKVIVPDSAHGTNPASAAVCGLQVVEVKSNAQGNTLM